MVEEVDKEESGSKKSGGKAILFGLVLALVLGGAGFYVGYSGMLEGGSVTAKSAKSTVTEEQDVTFVPLEPLIISVGKPGQPRHLRFRAHVDVAPEHAKEIEAVMPRISDILNGYLRSVDIVELERPASLFKIRIEMLRRIQLVVGKGKVRDLLVTEFVLT